MFGMLPNDFAHLKAAIMESRLASLGQPFSGSLPGVRTQAWRAAGSTAGAVQTRVAAKAQPNRRVAFPVAIS